MPSMEESRRQVKEHLSRLQQQDEDPHHDILASFHQEIDDHNEARSRPSTRFRFKGSSEPSRKRRHRSTPHNGEARPHKHKKHHHDHPPPPAFDDAPAPHPFPREPTEPDQPTPDAAAAFRASLFDALADDEGAQYWESVYSQPIHIYPRPAAAAPGTDPAAGPEPMDDEAYAAYVQTRMWERKNPHLVQERERSQRRRKEEEEERARRREAFVRRKEQAAWERAQRSAGREVEGEDDAGVEWAFAGDGDAAPSRRREEEYAAAWSAYLRAWEELSEARPSRAHADAAPASRRIPWPVLASKPVVKPNIEAFMRGAPQTPERSTLQVLKAERVRWHPDKVQQRFGGHVEEGTMKIVTGVFQVVDGLLEEERRKNGTQR